MTPTTHEEMLQVIAYLNAAVSNSRLYSANHPQVIRYLERTHDQLRKILHRQSEFTFLLVDDDLVVENHAMTLISPQLEQFVTLLKQCAIERITFGKDASPESLAQLVKELADTGQDVVRSTPGIILGKVKVLNAKELEAQKEMFTPEIKEKLAELESYRDRSMDNIKDMYHQIKSSKEISQRGLGEVVKGFLQGMLQNVNPLQMLASLKSSDEYTFTHAINVCILTMSQAEALGIGGNVLYEIGIAASMHDAGKMFVPDEILNKADKLTNDEWQYMQDHAKQGALYILKLEGITKMAFLAALEHHIRYDGSGYPNLGKNWRPNIVSQMIAISDLFDAMRSRRPYKDPKPDALIIKILRQESGTSFNPRLVKNFLRLVRG